MTAPTNNPFVLPGLGQSGEMGQNPLLASMEMMRQAWQGLAGSAVPGLGPSAAAVPMSLEELDRRISDLRAVENWLRMNLTMLTSSIQALEVQRATIATLKSFITTPPGAASSAEGASPLEAALGIKPAAEPTGAAMATAHSVTQDWWNMLQKQFDTLAAATAATMQGAPPTSPPPQSAVKSAASKNAAPRKAARKRTQSSAAEKPRR